MIEEQIIQGCRIGDREAQRALYVRTSDRIYQLLLRITGDPDAAFDLAQDTYLKVFSHINQFDGGSSLTTWIYRIAINEARQAIRRNKRYSHKLQDLASSSKTQSNGGDEAAADGMDIRDALTRLPEFERNLIVLRHFDSLSYEDLAHVLERPPGTIASALNRARRMLRDLLEPKSTVDREDLSAAGHL